MKISKITGVISGDFVFHTKTDDEEFYVADFTVEENLVIPIQVSGYIKDMMPTTPLRLTGYLATVQQAEENSTNKLFTFFKVCSYEEVTVDTPTEKVINIGSEVRKLLPLQVAKNGMVSLTIVGKEVDADRRTSILHYTAKGSLARKLQGTLKPSDRVEGRGILYRKNHSIVVLLEKLDVVTNNTRKEK